MHIFQKNHKTTIILVQEDVDGPKRTPLLIDFSSSLQNQPVWDVLLSLSLQKRNENGMTATTFSRDDVETYDKTFEGNET